MDVGLIGLGLLGRAIAGRLIGAGHRVVGYDIAEGACAQAADLGVALTPDARDVVASTDTTFLCLLTSEDRRSLLWGEQDLAGSLRAGTLLVDTSTGRPADLVEDAQRLATAGVELIDACVSGSSKAVTEGTAIALVGAQESDTPFAPLLSTFTRRQFYLGELGAGLRVKLVVNLVFGLHRLVLAEALGLARKDGLDADVLLSVLKEGDTYSRVMDTKGPMMVAESFSPPQARLAQHAKDVGLIAEYAESLGARVPVTELHRSLIEALVAEGHGDEDNAAIYRAFMG